MINKLKLSVWIPAVCLILMMFLCSCSTNKTAFTPTDYTNMDNWAVNDYDNAEKKDTQVDVFYIYGTNAKEADQENGVANISDAMKTTTLKMDAGTAGCFNDGVRFYEPFYRQLAMEYQLENVKSHEDLPDMIRSTEVSTDLFAALDYYFENCNEGRPFILVGFSHGGACLQVILEDYFGQKQNRTYMDQMVAAYSIGYGVDKNWIEKIDYLKFASGAEDTGVVISWNTEGTGEKGDNFLLADNPSDTLVINPINWKTDNTYAKASECAGSYTEKGIVTPGLYNLQIDPERGCLISDNNENYAYINGESVFGGKSLHNYEFAEAYLSVRENMHQRIEAFLKK